MLSAPRDINRRFRIKFKCDFICNFYSSQPGEITSSRLGNRCPCLTAKDVWFFLPNRRTFLLIILMIIRSKIKYFLLRWTILM